MPGGIVAQAQMVDFALTNQDRRERDLVADERRGPVGGGWHRHLI